MVKQILILPGDGIGTEIMCEAIKLLNGCRQTNVKLQYGRVGGNAIEATGVPIEKQTINNAMQASAILLGAVGGPAWDNRISKRPENGLLWIRKALNLYCNIRPVFTQLVDIKLDFVIVRELTGGIYFGQPRGFASNKSGARYGYNTLSYDEYEISRIARVAFELAQKRNKRLCSIDKANVLEVTMLWREIISNIAHEYPDVKLTHMYVDNAAMQLVCAPKQFDVILTSNMFGDIISDESSVLTGSIGMLPSASINELGQGMFEPCHGSAPDIAGRGMANPLAIILSVAMMLRYSLNAPVLAGHIEEAVKEVLDKGLRTADIASPGKKFVSTAVMGDAVVQALEGRFT